MYEYRSYGNCGSMLGAWEHVRVQLQALSQYAYVQKALAQDQVQPHGWLFDMAHASLSIFDFEIQA